MNETSNLVILGMIERSYATSGSQRRRVLDNWTLNPAPEEPSNFYLTGTVVQEANGEHPGVPRETSTGVVRSRRGNVLITNSGSEYTLRTPATGQDPTGYLQIKE